MIGHVEQAGDIVARPGGAFDIIEPANPNRALGQRCDIDLIQAPASPDCRDRLDDSTQAIYPNDLKSKKAINFFGTRSSYPDRVDSDQG